MYAYIGAKLVRSAASAFLSFAVERSTLFKFIRINATGKFVPFLFTVVCAPKSYGNSAVLV